VKDCDPATGSPDSDEGYDDEYMVSYTADKAHEVVKDMFLSFSEKLKEQIFMDEFTMLSEQIKAYIMNSSWLSVGPENSWCMGLGASNPFR
jgi:hypothetical protein